MSLSGAVAPTATVPSRPVIRIFRTPAGVPPAQVTIAWSVPSDGGSAITGYLFTYNATPDGVSQVFSLPASQTMTVLSVSFGVNYRIHLVAQNAVGDSPTRSDTAIAIPYTAPSIVRNISVATGNLQFVATWDEPASWGGSTLSLYLVAWRDSSNNQEIHTVFSEAVTLSAHGGSVLVAGEGYNLAIIARAQSNQGSPPVRYPPGSGFITAAVVAATVPGAPAGFTASAVEGGASLSWSAPASDGGAAITGYVLSYGTVSAVLGNTLAATVGGLTAGVEYAFTLQAANSVGLGAAAVAGGEFGCRSAGDRAGRAAKFDGDCGRWRLIGITWSAPNSDGGATITAYIVYANSAAALTASGDARAATLTGLSNGTEYTLWVNARNSVGESSQSNATLATPQAAATAPGAPAGFTAVAVEGGASLQLERSGKRWRRFGYGLCFDLWRVRNN